MSLQDNYVGNDNKLISLLKDYNFICKLLDKAERALFNINLDSKFSVNVNIEELVRLSEAVINLVRERDRVFVLIQELLSAHPVYFECNEVEIAESVKKTYMELALLC